MVVTSPDERIRLSIYKGWAFVLLTGLLLYRAISVLLSRWMQGTVEHEQAESARQESEERYRRIFDVSTDAVFLVDCETNRLLDANPAAERMYGYSHEEFLRLQATDISAEPEQTRTAIATEVRHVPFRMHRRKDGGVFPVEISSSEFCFQQRRVHVAAMRDITERQRVETALQLSDFSVNHASLATFWISQDSRIVRVNAAACRQLGYTEAEMLQLAITDLDPNFAVERWPAHWVELRERKQMAFETGHQHKHGHVIPVEVSLNWFEFNGQEYNFAFVSDISERKLAAEELQRKSAFLEAQTHSSIDGILVVDEQGRKTFQNQRMTDLLKIPQAIAENVDDEPQRQWVMQAAQNPEQFIEKVIYLNSHRSEISRDEIEMKDGTILDRYSAPMMGRGGEYFGRMWIFRDITDRKRSEAALRESEGRLQNILQKIPVALCQEMHDGKIAFRNERFIHTFGYTEADVPGAAAWLQRAYPDPQYRREVEAQWTAAVRQAAETGGDIQPHEYQVTCKSGEVRTIEISGTGFAGGLLVTFLDLTARKMAEAALRESEYFFKESQRAARIGSYKADFVCGFWESSEVLDQIFGIGRSYRRTIQGWLDLVHPDDVKAVGDYLRREVIAGHKAFEREYRIIRPVDGEIRWVSGLGEIRFNAAGKVTSMIGTIRDITESKRAAEKLGRLAIAVEQAAEAIAITDIRGKMVYVNPAFEKVTGYTSAEAIGQNPRILKSGKQDDTFYRQMWAVLRNGEIWSGRFVNRRKDGVLFEEEVTISPIRDTAGKVVNYVAVKRDVTREVLLESQYRQAQKMEAIGTLAGGIAHDFNNILAAMFGYGYLVREDVAGNAVALENIDEILNAAGRAKDLVQQILTFSRQREQKRQIVRLHTVVKEAVKFLRASLPAGIQIQMELDSAAPAVLADPTQIYQVILNLATNAFHAMEGRNGTLTVRLQGFEPSGPFLESHPEIRPLKYTALTVTDTGQGMDAKTIERMFEPFFTTKPVGKGTGLGLAVVHGIVQSHEAGITVESEVGRGTTFNLYFPAQTDVLPQIPCPVQGAPKGKGQRILVVDDEKALTAVFDKLLSRMGYRVTTRNSPHDAFELFSHAPDQFDAVITDLTMPEMNGVELAQQIHQLRPELPILLASGFNTGLDPAKLREHGIRTLIEKPVSRDSLSEALDQLVGAGHPLPK